MLPWRPALRRSSLKAARAGKVVKRYELVLNGSIRFRSHPSGATTRMAKSRLKKPSEPEYSFMMPLMERLLAWVSKTGLSSSGAVPGGDESLAVAALLVHVARIDGIVEPGEERGMRALLRGRFGLTPAAADDLVARAEQVDREIGDIAELVERMGHAGLEERRRVLAMAYAIAAADGTIGEFEDDLVWRLGRLFGLSEAEIEEVRALEAGDLRPAAEPAKAGP